MFQPTNVFQLTMGDPRSDGICSEFWVYHGFSCQLNVPKKLQEEGARVASKSDVSSHQLAPSSLSPDVQASHHISIGEPTEETNFSCLY